MYTYIKLQASRSVNVHKTDYSFTPLQGRESSHLLNSFQMTTFNGDRENYSMYGQLKSLLKGTVVLGGSRFIRERQKGGLHLSGLSI